MLPDSSCEPAGAAHNLSCPSCPFDFQTCRPAHDFPTTYAALVDMFSNDCSMMTDSSSQQTLRRENSKRSVPSMKNLLPLKLLSPTLPQPHKWPSTGQDRRSTFGALPSSRSTPELQPVKGRINNPLGLRLSLLPPRQLQRDTPIYTEPGSPLPERAYYSNDDVCFNASPPESIRDGRFVSQDENPTDTTELENEIEDEVASQSSIINEYDLRRRSYEVASTPRTSDLSFQCSGEPIVLSEAAWLSSPLPNSPRSQRGRHRSTIRQPVGGNVETWLSDTASEIGENVLACATAVSPKRAQVIQVNTNRLSNQSIPPRVSSLNAPFSANLGVRRYSWASSDDSPPDTPTGEYEFDDRASFNEPQWVFPSPNRRFDLAMNSPPMSPKVSRDPLAASRLSFSVMSAGIETDEDANMVSRWSLDPSTSEDKSTVDIITDLEDIVAGFPTNMLLPDTPCITEIRLGLNNTNQEAQSPITSSDQNDTRSNYTNDSRSVANFSRPRTTLTSSRSSPAVQRTAWRFSFISSSSTIQLATRLTTPDLTPLTRIFPNSSEYTRLALYGHILAHIFLASLPTTPRQPQIEPIHPRRRRDTPYWTASQTSGRPRISTSHLLPQASEDTFQARVATLKSKLRKCIFRLMNNMDSSVCQANLDGRAELMLRAVEEVVRASEKLSCPANC